MPFKFKRTLVVTALLEYRQQHNWLLVYTKNKKKERTRGVLND